MELGGPNHSKKKNAFPGLYVASSCLLSNLWPLQICFPALGAMWWPPRMAMSLSFVYKYGFIWRGGPPKLSLHAFVGAKSGASPLLAFSKGCVTTLQSGVGTHAGHLWPPPAGLSGLPAALDAPGLLILVLPVQKGVCPGNQPCRRNGPRALNPGSSCSESASAPILVQRTWMAFHPCDREEGSVPLLLGLVCYLRFEFRVFRYIPCWTICWHLLSCVAFSIAMV